MKTYVLMAVIAALRRALFPRPTTAAYIMRVQQELFHLIHAVTGRRRLLTVPRPLAGFMGSLEGGLFLSQLLYWSDRSTAPGSGEGWFYKSFSGWEAETMLSAYKVRKFTAICCRRGFLEIDVRPVNGVATTHYHLRLDRLQEQLLAYLRAAPSQEIDSPPPENSPGSPENSPRTPPKICGRPPEKIDEASRKIDPATQKIDPSSFTESISENMSEKTTDSTPKSPAGPPPNFNAGDWRAVLDELQGQVPAATFEHALQRCRFLRRDGDLVLVAARSPYAADAINHRLRPVVERTLNGWLRAGGVSGRRLRVRALPPGDLLPAAASQE